MKIIIEIENRSDFDPNILVSDLNRQFAQWGRAENRYWAKLIGIEPEDDEND